MSLKDHTSYSWMILVLVFIRNQQKLGSQGLWCKHSNFQHPVDSGLSNPTTVVTLLEHLIWYMMTWCTSHFFYCCVTLLICLLMKVTRLKKTNRVYLHLHTHPKNVSMTRPIFLTLISWFHMLHCFKFKWVFLVWQSSYNFLYFNS